MAFFRKSRSQNYDLFSTHAYYVPGVGGMFALLGLLLVGSLVGSLITHIMTRAGIPLSQDWTLLISYPIMFIPPILYASAQGRRNLLFEDGYKLDNEHFSPKGGAVLAVTAIIGTLSCAFVMDAVNGLLPPMPEWLEKMLGSLTTGNVWLNFICVSLFAPFFEEWLCRGMVLRGLLNSRQEDGRPLMSPALAIVISALFFGVIHLNPWQALPAFALGLLMGYVYYRTGSLKLTMLIHFTNNTFALILSHIDGLADVDSLRDVMTDWVYALVWVLNLAILAGAVYVFRSVQPQRKEGSCEILHPEEITV